MRRMGLKLESTYWSSGLYPKKSVGMEGAVITPFVAKEKKTIKYQNKAIVKNVN